MSPSVSVACTACPVHSSPAVLLSNPVRYMVPRSAQTSDSQKKAPVRRTHRPSSRRIVWPLLALVENVTLPAASSDPGLRVAQCPPASGAQKGQQFGGPR